MNHDLIRVLAEYAAYFLLFLVPVLVLLFTQRFNRELRPDQYTILFAIVAAVGLLLFLPALTIVAALALGALGLAWLTGRFSLTSVTYHRAIEPSRLFPGDRGTIRIELANRKILPLASLTLSDPVRYGLLRPGSGLDDLLRFSGGIEVLEDLHPALVNRTAVGPYSEVRRTYQLEAIQRGVYALGPATVQTGDTFGIFRREGSLGGHEEIIVYPRVYRPDELPLPFRQAMGELVARRALIDDPTLIAGSREYRPGDPLKRMHWRATARTGDLQVRLFDPSTTAQLMIVLNLNTYQHIWHGVDFERMEAAVELGASLGMAALDTGFAIGLRSNGVIPGSDITPRLAPSANPRQATLLLEHLARLTYSGRFTAEEVLLDEVHRIRAGVAIVFVTSVLTPDLISILTGRQLDGRCSVLYCGRAAAPVIRGLPVHLVARPPRQVRSVAS